MPRFKLMNPIVQRWWVVDVLVYMPVMLEKRTEVGEEVLHHFSV